MENSWIHLFLLLVCLVLVTGTAFIRQPESSRYLKMHYFPCHCQGTTTSLTYVWRINGAIVTSETPDVFLRLYGSISVMEILCTEERNMSMIECGYRQQNGTFVFSEAAIMRVQGTPDPVTNIAVKSSQTSITLTWDPLLEITPVGLPHSSIIDTSVSTAITYNVEVINNNTGESDHFNTTDTSFTFTIENPDPSDSCEFIVTAFNVLGQGMPSQRVLGRFAEVPTTSPSNPSSTPTIPSNPGSTPTIPSNPGSTPPPLISTVDPKSSSVPIAVVVPIVVVIVCGLVLAISLVFLGVMHYKCKQKVHDQITISKIAVAEDRMVYICDMEEECVEKVTKKLNGDIYVKEEIMHQPLVETPKHPNCSSSYKIPVHKKLSSTLKPKSLDSGIMDCDGTPSDNDPCISEAISAQETDFVPPPRPSVDFLSPPYQPSVNPPSPQPIVAADSKPGTAVSNGSAPDPRDPRVYVSNFKPAPLVRTSHNSKPNTIFKDDGNDPKEESGSPINGHEEDHRHVCNEVVAYIESTSDCIPFPVQVDFPSVECVSVNAVIDSDSAEISSSQATEQSEPSPDDCYNGGVLKSLGIPSQLQNLSQKQQTLWLRHNDNENRVNEIYSKRMEQHEQAMEVNDNLDEELVENLKEIYYNPSSEKLIEENFEHDSVIKKVPFIIELDASFNPVLPEDDPRIASLCAVDQYCHEVTSYFALYIFTLMLRCYLSQKFATTLVHSN